VGMETVIISRETYTQHKESIVCHVIASFQRGMWVSDERTFEEDESWLFKVVSSIFNDIVIIIMPLCVYNNNTVRCSRCHNEEVQIQFGQEATEKSRRLLLLLLLGLFEVSQPYLLFTFLHGGLHFFIIISHSYHHTELKSSRMYIICPQSSTLQYSPLLICQSSVDRKKSEFQKSI